MKEAAHAAMSYVRSRALELGLVPDFYSDVDIHIHYPEGAIPKDGPSAGITTACGLVSALTGIPLLHNVAMTGEITLRGRVLPIGGLKEKVIAAHRAGIDTVIAPKENEKDLRDIPKQILKQVTMRFVEHMDEVLAHAFVSSEYQALLDTVRARTEDLEAGVADEDLVGATTPASSTTH
jgi:ATP-dependent Lon protease